jgi:hypothetical protein
MTIVSSMPTADSFANPLLLRKYLGYQLLSGRLVLVLGAGISAPIGLPDWPQLLTRLYASKSAAPPADTSLERQAEYFRVTYYRDDKPAFLKAVHDCLYKDVAIDFNALRQNATLAAIAALVMASKRGSASSVITFNWDNLLELYLSYHGFVAASVHKELHWLGNEDVAIFHPHGYLPFDSLSSGSKDIVFDQLSYGGIVGNDSLPWRQQLLSLLRTHSCLFIGLSGNDQNLDSLLIRSLQEHACTEEGTRYWGVTFNTDPNPIKVSFWNERGVYYNKIENYEVELPGLLFGICQEAAKLRAGLL